MPTDSVLARLSCFAAKTVSLEEGRSLPSRCGTKRDNIGEEDRMRNLMGKVAVITGAGRGLGRAYALRLASLGADVVINDIRLEAPREFDEELTAPTVMAECEALGVRSIGIEADVTQHAEVERMFNRVMREFGRVDILINNAGGVLIPPARGYASTVTEAD